MALSGKELESHKAKRLVARNEMIGAAQVMINAFPDPNCTIGSFFEACHGHFIQT